MENKNNCSVVTDALSPSRITDYFNSSRTKTKGNHGSAKQQQVSIYLTPESSPAGDFGSDPPREGDETSSTTNVYPAQDPCHIADTQAVDSTAVPTNTHPPVSDVSDGTTHPTKICTGSRKSNKKLNVCEQVNSDNSQVRAQLADNSQVRAQLADNSQVRAQLADNSQVRAQLADNSQVRAQLADNSQGHSQSTDNSKSTPVKSRQAKGRNPNIISETSESQAISPSVPRPKLRKGATSSSQSDALVPASTEPSKPKPARRKKKEPEPIQKNVITDFFPVRRSGRITKSEIEKEKQHQLEQMILSKCEDGLKVTDFENKGRGVVATKDFQKGDFIIEYAGELIDTATARQREIDYATNPQIGCYMYFFSMGPKNYCVDATAESDRLGRLINHSREGNCSTKAVIVNSRPRLILVASRNIQSGEELSYDYGDRSKAAIEAHPWLKL